MEPTTHEGAAARAWQEASLPYARVTVVTWGKYEQETDGGRTLGVLKTRDSRQRPPAFGPISFQILQKFFQRLLSTEPHMAFLDL